MTDEDPRDLPRTARKRCNRCHGSGSIRKRDKSGAVVLVDCGACNGTGLVAR